MKIEEGKYYRTRDGRKVGPAMRLNPDRAFDDICWARFHSGGDIFEIAGVEPEDAFDTRLVSEWTDTPKAWKDLTPEEKGALLLAHHEGRTLQYYNEAHDLWSDTDPTFHPMDILRIKPEPARKTVTLYGAGWHYEQAEIPCDDDTHRITFDLVDGEPDTDSIKMEKL